MGAAVVGREQTDFAHQRSRAEDLTVFDQPQRPAVDVQHFGGGVAAPPECLTGLGPAPLHVRQQPLRDRRIRSRRFDFADQLADVQHPPGVDRQHGPVQQQHHQVGFQQPEDEEEGVGSQRDGAQRHHALHQRAGHRKAGADDGEYEGEVDGRSRFIAAGCDEAEEGGGIEGHGRSIRGGLARNGQAGTRRRARLGLWIGSPASSKFAGIVGRLRRTAELRPAMAGLGRNRADCSHR